MSAIDLARLPAPKVIEPLDYETIFAQMLDDLRERAPQLDALVESDPAYKILQVSAYRELLLRQRINQAARSVMLAYAEEGDLEQLGALFGVSRQIVESGDITTNPPTEPVYEDLERYRQRIPLSLEGLSTAGPIGAYKFHCFDASGEVKDVSVTSPAPGEVRVTLLSQSDNGTASAALISTIEARLNHEDIRPLTDSVTVQSATIVNYQVEAELVFFKGPDSTLILELAEQKVNEFVQTQHKLGLPVTLSGLYAELHQTGVQNVRLNVPIADIDVSDTEAAYCDNIVITHGGYYE